MTDENQQTDTVNESPAATEQPKGPDFEIDSTVKPEKKGHTFDKPVEIDPSEKKLRPGFMDTYVFGPSGYTIKFAGEVLDELIKDKSRANKHVDLTRALWFGEDLRLADRLMDPALADDDRDFRQGVQHNGGVIGTRSPSVGNDQEQLKGLSAVHAVNAALGLGGTIYQPMWGGGFQVAFKPPLLKQRHEFDFMAAVNKERYGWLTAGFTFSASNIVSMSDAVRFAMSHVHDTTLPSKEPEDILKAIPLPDVHTFLAAFATTFFLDGFPMTRGCPHCKQTYKSLISIPRCILADNTKVSNEQREIISLTTATKKRLTNEQVKKYQSLHKWNNEVNRYEVKDHDIVFYFKVPSLFDALTNSDKWATEIRDTLVLSMGAEITDNQRDSFMRERANKTILRQYSHWVEKIVVKGGNIEDESDINDVLISILEHDDVKNSFVSSVRKFIRSTTIGVVALPAHECPSCKEVIMDQDDASLLPDTVALDPLELFFALVTLSVQASLPE